MRISDWSSDVCSADLLARLEGARDTLDTTPIIDPRRRWRVAWPNASTILHRLDVATGGKGAAGACQYGDTDRIIRFHILDRRNQVVAILDAADRVQPCRAVECQDGDAIPPFDRSEEHTSELQSLMRISYAVFCLKKKIDKHKDISHQ